MKKRKPGTLKPAAPNAKPLSDVAKPPSAVKSGSPAPASTAAKASGTSKKSAGAKTALTQKPAPAVVSGKLPPSPAPKPVTFNASATLKPPSAKAPAGIQAVRTTPKPAPTPTEKPTTTKSEPAKSTPAKSTSAPLKPQTSPANRVPPDPAPESKPAQQAKPVPAPSPAKIAPAEAKTTPAAVKPIPSKMLSPRPVDTPARKATPKVDPKLAPVAAAPPKQVPAQTKPARVVPIKQVAEKPAAVTAVPPVHTVGPTKPIIPVIPPIVLGEAPLEVLRPEDLVSFYLDFVNLKLDTSNTRDPKLVVDDASNPAYLVVWFAPQAILEKAYFETATITSNSSYNPPVPVTPTGNDTLPIPGTVPAYLAGRSRLVFEVPKSVKSIPYTIEGLLDWSQLQLVVSPVALGAPLPPPLTAPTFLETAIELPWRIVLSPAEGVGWAHASEPETFAGRTALWHTRLGKVKSVKSGKTTSEVIDEASATNTIPLRAIWSDDFVDHTQLPLLDDEKPFRASLDPHDRVQIVILTSGTLGYFVPGTVGPGTEWTPVPIQASRLFLSPLGGYLDSRGAWPNPPSYTYTDPTTGQPATQELDLIEWDHQATLGRDQYVRVVYAGYLYPFGHAASLIKVTERKIVSPDIGGNVNQTTAFLRQRMYIVVREPEKSYAADTGQYKYGARENPFWQSISLKTKVTPDISIPVMITGDGNTHNSFWVEVGGTEFQFHVEATDLAGATINFLAPLIFMSVSEDYPAGVQSIYASAGSPRTCTVHGQKIAYADPGAGDTTLRTTELNFTTQLLLTQPPYPIAPFLPTLDNATVTVPAVEQILGTATPVEIQLYPGYLANKIDPNAGVYAIIPNNPPTIAFNAGQSGGFSTPVLVMSALSARKGLVAGSADDAAAGNMNPSEFFDLSAKLFGSVPLQQLIPVGADSFAPALQNAPEIRTVLKPNSKAPTQSITRLNWSPQLQDYPQPPDQNNPVQVQFGHSAALTLKAELTRNLAGGPPSSQISGQLTDFQLSLLGVIALTFNSIKFTSINGQKLNVAAKLPSTNAISFIGALSFIQTLANILPPGIFGGGPSIDLEPSEIVVTFTIGLPPVSIGIISIENISITTGLALPYLSGEPGFEFAFAKRSSPFLITVECLGGGGFVHLIVTASGVQMVEGSLEFGGEFSLDLGVASGSVHAMAGIYFMLSGNASDITGFVDIGGEVSVLAIISVSLDLNLSLSYETSNGKSMVQGRATMTVAVHVLFFSASVSISVERSFGSDAGDPRVDAVLTAQNWSDYAAAYA